MSRTPPPDDGRVTRINGWRPGGRFWIVVLVLVGVLIVVGVASNASRESNSGSDAGGDATDTSKYTQTWSTPYDQTLCSDWSGSMTDQQRFAAAADMLSAARDKIDGGSGVAPDTLIDRMEADITTTCTADDTDSIAAIAVLAYQMDSRYKP